MDAPPFNMKTRLASEATPFRLRGFGPFKGRRRIQKRQRILAQARRLWRIRTKKLPENHVLALYARTS